MQMKARVQEHPCVYVSTATVCVCACMHICPVSVHLFNKNEFLKTEGRLKLDTLDIPIRCTKQAQTEHHVIIATVGNQTLSLVREGTQLHCQKEKQRAKRS